MAAPDDPGKREAEARLLAEQVLEIGRRCAALPDLDLRPAEAILRYDEHGLLE